MNAQRHDIAALLELQKVDLSLMKDRRAFDQLPQRALIVAAREKRKGLEEKRAQVDALVANVEQKVASIESESGRLAEKRRDIQQAIDAAKGDYRNVEARTKELSGIAKREAVIEQDLVAAGEQLEKAEAVRTQIARALEAVAHDEEKATAAFRVEGGELQDRIAKGQARRVALVAALPTDLANLYEKTAAAHGGVAVGVLSETTCGTCRSQISHERLIDLKRQAPIAICPSCHRMLIIA